MYDYRRMSIDERRQIVEERRARGFPWHRPPHADQGDNWYFITAATYEHQLLFTAPRELRALELRLLEAFANAGLPCAGWVVLPNHYHAIVRATDLALVGRALGPVHGRSAQYANRRDDAAGRRVWNRFSDRRIRSERHFFASLHYVVYNPVKHGYVEAATDWPWSCWAELVREYGADWVSDLAMNYPLLDFGDGWDP